MNAQQLKNAILQEAIEGRLVPQDPNDEPASALLARIRKEKEHLVKAGKLKKKDLVVNPISEDEIPFKIPESWEWVRLKDIIFGTGAGKSPNCEKRPKSGNEWGVIPTTAIQYCAFLPNENKVLPSKFIINELQIVKDKDLLITRAGPKNRTGIVCVVDKPCDNLILSDKTVRIDYFRDYCNPFFLMFALNNPTIHDSIMSATVGMAESQVNISQSSIQNIVVPFPPLAEQKRIVAKIEELMPKVEKYGKAQDELNKLNEELPERLKKSILQEAIEGRLVPQDPNDEPASVLLAKIRKEKEQLVKEGKLKKKDLIETPITEDEIPFDIPASWKWVRLGNLVSNQTGLSYNKGDLEKKVDNPIRVLRGGNIQNGSWCTKVDDVMIAPEYVKKPNLSLQKNTFITPAVTSLEHLGKTALIEEDHSDIVAGGFVLYLLPFYRDDIFSKYLSYYFQSAYYNAYCQSIANKSGQAFWNLSRQKLMELVLPIPPLAEQQRIVEKLEQMLGEIDKLKQ